MKVQAARFSDESPSFLNRPARRGRKRQGVLYETKALAHLGDRFGELFLPGPWVRFSNEADTDRWCQPDGIILDPTLGRVVITETKLRHCAEAWFQLFELYIPVFRVMFPQWIVVGVEVCRWFDPATPTPAPAVLRKNPVEAIDGKFNVHIWV